MTTDMTTDMTMVHVVTDATGIVFGMGPDHETALEEAKRNGLYRNECISIIAAALTERTSVLHSSFTLADALSLDNYDGELPLVEQGHMVTLSGKKFTLLYNENDLLITDDEDFEVVLTRIDSETWELVCGEAAPIRKPQAEVGTGVLQLYVQYTIAEEHAAGYEI